MASREMSYHSHIVPSREFNSTYFFNKVYPREQKRQSSEKFNASTEYNDRYKSSDKLSINDNRAGGRRNPLTQGFRNVDSRRTVLKTYDQTQAPRRLLRMPEAKKAETAIQNGNLFSLVGKSDIDILGKIICL